MAVDAGGLVLADEGTLGVGATDVDVEVAGAGVEDGVAAGAPANFSTMIVSPVFKKVLI